MNVVLTGKETGLLVTKILFWKATWDLDLGAESGVGEDRIHAYI